MNLLDLYEGREPYQQAIDRLEQRRIEDLEAKMDDYAKRGMKDEFQKCKAERDSYYKLREAGIGQDIVNKTEKMSRATTQSKAGAVASTVKNAAKWLAGKGGPGKEGPTYEGADDIVDRGEYDREGDMAKDNIHTIVRNARELESVISDNDNLPEWVQDKLANIKGMMTAVSEYMQTQHERDHEEGVTIAEKLKGLPTKKLGSARDIGKSVRKFRSQRGLEEAGTADQWHKEEPWTKVPKAKSGKPVDPRGEVAHMSDVARRETERKAAQKKNSKEVAEHGGGIGPKQHWQDLMPEGFQDFNKVEPYAVCLSGKPVKKFDYYEDARRFHDNWKKKLYREGDQAKAEKITLMPLNLDEEDQKPYNPNEFRPVGPITIVPPRKLKSGETHQGINDYWKAHGQAPIYKTNEDEALRDPWNEKHFGPGEVIQKVFKVKADNGKSYNIKAATEQAAKETLQKHAPDANIVSIKFVSNVMNEEDQDTSSVESAIIRRIMVSHLDWLQKFGPEKVMQAAEEVAYNVGDVDEIGTSDVSAYVHEVGQILGVDQ